MAPMPQSHAIRHRRARWKALSAREKASVASRRLDVKRFMDDLMGRKGVPLEQTLLEGACNQRVTRRRDLDKAAAMGARPNERCNNRGGLAMHHYARHGLSAADASDLLARGFDPMAPDAEGRCFAHHAFEFQNLPMALWIAEQRPESWARLCALGLTPMDLACAEPHGSGRCETEQRGAFRDWAFAAMPPTERDDFLAHAWERSARLLRDRTYNDCELDLSWLELLGERAPAIDGAAILAAVDLCDPWISSCARPFFERAIATTERATLQSVTEPALRATRRAARAL